MEQHAPPQVEVLEVGRPGALDRGRGAVSRRGRHRSRHLDLLMGGAVAVAAVITIVHGQPGQPYAGKAPAPIRPLHQPAAVVQRVSPLRDVPGDWALVALTGQSIVRVDLAAGTVSSTPLVPTAPDDPIARWDGRQPVVVGETGTFGDTVMSEHTLVPLGGAAATSPVVLRGPHRDEVWVAAKGHEMRLVGLTGWPTDVAVPLPPHVPLSAVRPDGAGYLLVPSAGAVYATRPGHRQLVTRGRVVAIGAGGWLVRECTGAACRLVLSGRAR